MDRLPIDKKTVTIVYEPNTSRKISFFDSFSVIAQNIWVSRELIRQLFIRDFLAVHKKSFLGIGWIILSPIIGITSWVFMNAAGILRPGDVGIPYPAFVLLSTSLWGLFMGFYQSATGTLSAGQGFIMQVKFPHEALLSKQILEQLANFIISFFINILILLAFGVSPSWTIVFLPLVALPLFFLGAGIGLIVAVIGVVLVEVRKILDFVFGFLIFLTPVIYAYDSSNGALSSVIRWNPLTYLIDTARNVTLYGRFGAIEPWVYASIFSFLVFIVAWRFFFIAEQRVIEKMI